MNPNLPEQREDGPALQKLFTKIEPPTTYRESVPEGLDVMADREPVFLAVDPAVEGSDTTVLEAGGESVALPNPYDYARELAKCGDVAINILKEMCDAEMALGNPKNMPEPVLGWYALTLTNQLVLLEACNGPQRQAHAEQLAASLRGVRSYKTPYADGICAEVAAILEERKPMIAKLWPELDVTYGGVL